MPLRRAASGYLRAAVVRDPSEDIEAKAEEEIGKETVPEIIFGVLFIVGSCLFIAGTIFFFPNDYNLFWEDQSLGCRLYDVGSVIFTLLSLYSAIELMHLRRHAQKNKKLRELADVKRSQIVEQFMYFIGSVLFLCGTLIWDPPVMALLQGRFGRTKVWWQGVADIVFMVGSCMFAFASFLNALGVKKETRYQSFPRVALMVASCFEFGGLFFVAGTMGFVPGSDCNSYMTFLGCMFYMAGSVLYLLGSVLSFMWTGALLSEKKKRLIKSMEKKERMEKRDATLEGHKRDKRMSKRDDMLREAKEAHQERELRFRAEVSDIVGQAIEGGKQKAEAAALVSTILAQAIDAADSDSDDDDARPDTGDSVWQVFQAAFRGAFGRGGRQQRAAQGTADYVPLRNAV